ncbi:hypothetical protein PQ472_09480 [Lacticaseibacillus pabuli]|uniref:Uncharacterized protein n=1 Tax=Lacticaseibacillus pabuli TaxID=3025672 RepID=A0ABY7WRW2_9LACO|nr:hypothetical protein [Lacticaseibacillus sp. KACC 23028]WDF82118.1 hypothetical protein PQ472_09480 [Lacticaseibacillus sp. KACC 23028]
MDTASLSAKQRSNIWNSLSRIQQQAIMQLTQFSLRKNVIGQSFNGHDHWRLTKVNIDYNWESRRTGQRAVLTCLCGHPLKYQFELHRLPKQDQQVLLGYACFADYAGIDRDVTRRLRDDVDAIQGEMDYTLSWYIKGRRFPEKSLGLAIDGGAIDGMSDLKQRVTLLRQADFPMNQADNQVVRSLVRAWKKQHQSQPATKRTRAKQPALSRNPEIARIRRQLKTSTRYAVATYTDTLTTLIQAIQADPELQNRRTILRRLSQFSENANRLVKTISTPDAKMLLTLKLHVLQTKQLSVEDFRKLDTWARKFAQVERATAPRRQKTRQSQTTYSGPNLKILRQGKHRFAKDEAIRYQRYIEMTGH